MTAEEAEELLITTQKANCDNAQVYHAYMSYHASNGNIAAIISKFNELKNTPDLLAGSTDVHAIVFHAMHDAGDMDGMVRIAEELRIRKRLTMTSAERESLLLHLARTDLARCADWWFHLSTTLMRLRVEAYNGLIAAFARSGRRDGLNVLEHMQKNGVAPNEETYSLLLDSVDSDRNCRAFDRLLMKTRTKEAWNAMLVQCIRKGNFARSEELRRYVHERVRGEVKFTTATYNLVLAAYAKQDDAVRCRTVLREMRERGAAPDTVTYEVAANLYARAGNARALHTLVLDMRADGLALTRNIYLALMDVFVTRGDCEGCEKIFDLMKVNGMVTSATVYDKMIAAYGNEGELQKALSTLEEMQNDGITPTTTTYNLIIAAHAKQGQSYECIRFYDRMKANSLAPDMGTFAEMLNAHVKQREFQTSRKYFEEMVNVMSVKDAFGAIMQYCSMKSSIKKEEFPIACG